MKDKQIQELIEREQLRQRNYVELIASENFVSEDVLEASGSILTNKYAEGYSGARYYGGCEVVDEIETLAIERLKKIFNAKYANVQPHSGSQANQAAYAAILKPGDKIMGMSLNSGGHLTHGYHVSFSGQVYESVPYEVDEETHALDYEAIREQALREKPDLIICGASSYSRIIDFSKFREIADEVGAKLMADVAHIAGLIVAGLHPNPLDAGADIVTSTTHKTLRGARGGIIMTNDEELAKKINFGVFPYAQGGPLMHQIAGKAVAFAEADTPEYKEYMNNVVINAKAMADKFTENGAHIISGTTENHLLIVEVKESFGIKGNEAERLLGLANIILNKNSIPFDKEKPTVASGVRMGTAAMTTKGWEKEQFEKLADIMIDIFKNPTDEYAISRREDVLKLLK